MSRYALFMTAVIAVAFGCGTAEKTASPTGSAPNNPPVNKQADPKPEVGFASLQPVLGRCAGCHSGAEAKEELDLTSYAGVMKGSEHGPVVVAGKPEDSMLVHALKGEHGKKLMPPGGRLPDEEIEKVEAWIREGARE